MSTSQAVAASGYAHRRQAQRGWRRWPRVYARPLVGGISTAAALVFWELFARAQFVDPLFLPAPTTVAGHAWELLSTGDILPDLKLSAIEFLAGFVLALATAIPLGLAAGWYPRLHYMTNPFVATLYALPRIALVPWILLLFGIGYLPKVVLVFMGVFFPVIINARDGVRTVDRDYLRLARSFGASRLWTFVSVVLPASVPFTLAGVRIGIGTGLIGLVIAEFITANAGIGYRIHVAGHQLDTPTVFAGIVILAAVSVALTRGVDRIERRFSGWQLGAR
ncbi:MAG TPA: ABC transporter permease [Chloroflexota bacterium]